MIIKKDLFHFLADKTVQMTNIVVVTKGPDVLNTSETCLDRLEQASPNGGPRSGSGPSDVPIRTHDQFKIIIKKNISFFFFYDFTIQSMITLVKSFLTEIQIEK